MNDLATKDWGLEADTAELAVAAISMMADPFRMIASCQFFDLRGVYDSGWGVVSGFNLWWGKTTEQLGVHFGYML